MLFLGVHEPKSEGQFYSSCRDRHAVSPTDLRSSKIETWGCTKLIYVPLGWIDVISTYKIIFIHT